MKHLLDKLDQSTKTIWPAIIWSALIFVLLMIPSNQLPGERLIPIPHFDKFIHFILFGVFAILWNIHLSKCKSFINDRKRFIVILTGIGVYGLLLELMQNITGRQFDVYDLIADLTGVIIIKYPGLEISPGMNKKNKKLFR